MKEDDVRLEAIKAAAKVAQPMDGVAHLLIHARWITEFVITGRSPAPEIGND